MTQLPAGQIGWREGEAPQPCPVCGLIHPGAHPVHEHHYPGIGQPCECGTVQHLRAYLGPKPEYVATILAALGVDDLPEVRRHHPGVYFARK